MAEETGRDGVAAVTRRPSLRKTVRDGQPTLPEKYLEALEQKRKQLDESIHKYIAAKEREYKLYERDVRQHAKGADVSPTLPAQQDEGLSSSASIGAAKRRLSSEATPDTLAENPRLREQQSSAVDASLAAGVRGEPKNLAVEEDQDEQRVANAGLTDRRASAEREKEFLGVFTPPYLPAIDNAGAPPLARADSAPAVVQASSRDGAAHNNKETLHKAESDSGLQAKAKHPAHLQAIRRTSSSGSSADGKLASAMKSTGHHARLSKKRVSLAVGDSIVAPSDNVPIALDHHSTPSHSRRRVPSAERGRPVVSEPTTATMDFAAPPALTSVQRVEQIMNGGGPAATNQADKQSIAKGGAPSMPGTAPAASGTSPISRTQSGIDLDGDLFDLEDDSRIPHTQAENEEFENELEAEEDVTPGVVGRVDLDVASAELTGTPMSLPGVAVGEQHARDSDDELILEPTALPAPATADNNDEHAVHLEFGPTFASSSQQPTRPGFRRPSVNADPVFRGADYHAVEAQAVEEEIYGSSYSRPTSKGSFTGGSLGESYMAKHAEGMMKMRMAQRQNG
ncbi:hypothetical protein LTR08_008034 [Meristemomyces frigidus]|nr:hypothetical protein LTR08_008034 [Meristemomyces frigidus]